MSDGKWVEGRVRESADGLKRAKGPPQRLADLPNPKMVEAMRRERDAADAAREKWKQVAEDWDTNG